MYTKNLTAGDDVYAGDEGAPDTVDVVNGGDGNDQLAGGLGDDALHGDDGDDLLNGGVGDDILDGGLGDDTAVFSGAATDYAWSGDKTSATITGPDGTDTLTHVEHLKFGETVINLPAPAPANTAPGAPTDADASANSVAEGAANGTAIGGLSLGAVDPDAGQTLTYSLLDDAGGRFAIDAATGVVTVADATKLNFEAAASHQITVQVSDGTAASSASFTINVTNVAPTAGTDLDASANTVSEVAANGDLVGLTVGASDVNGGALTYTLVDNDGGRFAIDSVTGVVTVVDASLIDYDVATSHQITVRTSDGTDSAATDTIFTIAVANAAPTAPTDADTAAETVSEGAANGAVVGITALATEAKSGAVIYSLSDDAGGRFTIDAATGVVTVADATKLNFETAASHQIIVRAADAQGAASSQTFTIAVTNLAPTAPTDTDAAVNTVSEGAANGDAVGLTVSATDVHGGSLTYSLLDNAGGRFAINATTGVVTVANASLLNFETATSHHVVVQASDGAATSSASFTIDVANVAPGAPTDSNPAANTVSETAVNGTVVAGLSIGAAEPNGGAIYSLVDDAGGRFAINAATGVVTVADASLLDYDAAASHQITVHAADGSGGGGETTFTIVVANAAPTAPVDADTAVNTVVEGSANGVTVGITASAVEPKTGSVSYSLSDDAGGRFAIDATTGVVSVADGSKLNFEVDASHQITVRATDGQGAFSSQVFTIAVGNAPNGAPVDTNAAANAISEGAVNGDVVSGLTITAPDVNNGPLTYSLLDDAGGRFAIDPVTGVVTVANASLLNFEAASSHQITVQAASGAESASANFTITVTNAAPVVTDSNGAANTVTEAAANGTVVAGLTVAAADPHGGAVTYSLINNAGGRFALNTTTGVVTVLNGALLDHDTQSSHTITVQASDGLLTSSTDIVINLIDKIDSYWTGTAAANSFTVPDVQDWQLEGLGGNDTLTGGVGDDIIVGGAGDDILSGGGGNDTFSVNADEGFDAYDGGAGYDVIKAAGLNVYIGIKSLSGIEAISNNGYGGVNLTGTNGNDTLDFTNVSISWTPQILGGAGNDAITGSAGNDKIFGEAGVDTLRGGLGNDSLNGGSENDTLYGDDGADTFYGGTGDDTLVGGAGDDVFQIAANEGADSYDGGAGYDTIMVMENYTTITLKSLAGIEAISANGKYGINIAGTALADTLDFTTVSIPFAVVISAGAGDDVITGTTGTDTINGDAGNDTLNGGLGADTLDGGDGVDVLNGGDGNDTITGGAGNDSLVGGAGDDVFLIGLGAGLDAFDGGAGYDTIKAVAANVVISFSAITGIEAVSAGGFAGVTIGGSAGNDVMDFTNIQTTGLAAISGGAGNDTITGTEGADTLKGDAGADTIYGLGGNDVIDGGTGVDTLYGGAGDDTFLVGVDATLGLDSFDGGAGTDTIQATAANVTMYVSALNSIEVISSGGFTGVTMVATSAADTMDFTNTTFVGSVVVNGLAGADTITGGGGVDNLRGGDGNDTISGGAGNDLLYGDAGADTLRGGDGNDFLDGGTEVDSLFGGAGDDILIANRNNGTDAFDGGAGFDEVRANGNNVVISFSSLASIEKIGSGGFTNVTIGVDVFSTLANWDFSNIQLDGIGMISGGLQNDTIIGSAGNDVILGSLGADLLKGGLGDDQFAYGAPDIGAQYYDTVDGGAGWDRLVANAAGAVIQVATMTSVEEISSAGFAGVVLSTTTLADTLDLRGITVTGTVSINLNNGDDIFYGASSADIVDGGAGNDIIDTGDGDDVIQMSSNSGWDVVRGGAGYDKIIVTAPSVWVPFDFQGIEEVVGSSNTSIMGTTSNDTIDMRGVVVTNVAAINGNAGDDTIYGSDGADTLFGGAGFDVLYGGDGDDRFTYTTLVEADVVHGGAGYDTLVGTSPSAIISVSAMDGVEAITGAGNTQVRFFATDAANTFDLTNVAVSGIYYFALQGGDDTFIGSAAADYIFGGLGADTLRGGAGADSFAYRSAEEAAGDLIGDFASGEDKIDLSIIDAVPVGGGGGNEAFTFLGTGNFTNVQGQLKYTVASNGVVVSGDVNGDGVADFNITVLGVSSLSASDFVL